MWVWKFTLLLLGGWADPGARTPLCLSWNSDATFCVKGSIGIYIFVLKWASVLPKFPLTPMGVLAPRVRARGTLRIDMSQNSRCMCLQNHLQTSPLLLRTHIQSSRYFGGVIVPFLGSALPLYTGMCVFVCVIKKVKSQRNLYRLHHVVYTIQVVLYKCSEVKIILVQAS